MPPALGGPAAVTASQRSARGLSQVRYWGMKAYSEDLRLRIVMSALAAALPPRLAAAPDATLAEHCAWYEQLVGVPVADTTMSRVIRRLGWTRKKMTHGPAAHP